MVNNSVSRGKKMCNVSQQSGLVGLVIPEKSTSLSPPPPSLSPQWKPQYFYPLLHPDFQNLLMRPPLLSIFKFKETSPPTPIQIVFIAEEGSVR